MARSTVKKNSVLNCLLMLMVIGTLILANADSVQAGGGQWDAPDGITWDESDPFKLVVEWNKADTGDMEAYYEVGIFKGEELLETIFCSGTSANVRTFIESCEAGTYVIKVRTLDRYDSFFDGEWSVDYLEYEYQKPEKQLEVPGGIVWNGTSICWDAVAGADAYCVQLYDGVDVVVAITDVFVDCKCDLSEYLVRESAFYKVKVQAVSEDMNAVQSSEFSKKSEKYQKQTVAEEVAVAEVGVAVDGAELETQVKMTVDSVVALLQQFFALRN